MKLTRSQLSDDVAQLHRTENNALVRTAKDASSDRIEVEIGDTKSEDFFPQAKIKRWDNEVNFSLRWQPHTDTTPELSTEHDKIIYRQGKQAFRAYHLEPGAIGEDGGLEIDIVLDEKPTSNVFTFSLQTKELDFFYQPALSEEELKRGSKRPENVIGSYAVYHKTKKNNYTSGKAYKTGKAFHIYRPKVIDAKGNETWAQLHIDEEQGLLTVTVPQEFLDGAIYPVIVDPTFGYTSAGASDYYIGWDIGGLVATGAVGTAESITAHLDVQNFGGDNYVKYALYQQSNSVLIAQTEEYHDTAGYSDWKTLNFSSPPSVSAIDYVLCAWGDDQAGGITVSADSSGGGLHDSHNYGSWPNPASFSSITERLSIYATITSDFPVTTIPTPTQFATSVTSMNVNLPGSIVSGDLLLALVEVRNAGTWTLPSGWVELDAQLGGGSVGELTVFYKIADGTEGATASFTASTGTTAVWQVRKIENWHGTTPPEVTKASGDATTADPPSLSPSWGEANTLWLAVAGHTAASAAAFTAAPTNYANFVNSGASSGGAAVSIASSFRQNTAASEDPGTFTVANNRWWASMTIAVRPAGEVPGFTANNPQTNTFTNDTNYTYDAGEGEERVLVVVVGVDDQTDEISGITYDSVALTRARREVSDASNSTEIWYLVDPAEGENTLSIDTSASDEFVAITCYVKGAGGIGANAGKKGDSTTINVDITPQSDTSLLIGGHSTDASGVADVEFVAAEGTTLHAQMPNSGILVVRAGLTSKLATSTSSHNLSVTGGDDDWSAVALEIKAAGAATPVEVTPDAQTATVSQPVPTVTAAQNVEVTPSVQTLTASLTSPAISTTSEATISPEAQAATITLADPSISTVRNVEITPALQTLTTAQSEPNVQAVRHVEVSPSAQNVTTSVAEPTVDAVAQVFTQEGFRFRNDDGDEESATWLEDQDTVTEQPTETPLRLRFLIEATGNPTAEQFRLEYRKKDSDDDWRVV